MAFPPPFQQQPPPPRPPYAGPPGPPYAGPPQPPPRPGRPTVLGLTGRQWMVVALVVGSCYFFTTAFAMVGAWTTVNREPTTAELQTAANKEVARRWEAWPASRIFPDRIPYRPVGDHSEYASRTGIVPDTGCAQAVDEEIAATLVKYGCRAVLRATYTDQLQGVVVTVGVVAFPDPWKADRAFKELPGSQGPGDGSRSVAPALHAAAFPGTASARFTDEARQDRTIDRGGPYVVLTASGQSDGRPASAIKRARPGELFAVAPQLGHAVARALAAKALPDCDDPEWEC
ncbi:hypothetical protein ACFYYL_22950 [Actinomadura geliboluensis]|uniref:hypothetical protein n=1 Tax=Actinomadura geliboluensis TaxID=882440 RepID=UPI0036739BCB